MPDDHSRSEADTDDLAAALKCAVRVGLLTALAISFADLSRATTAGHSHLSAPLALLTPLAVMTAAMLVAYLAIWVPTHFVALLLGGRRGMASAGFAAAFLSAATLTYLVADVASGDARVAVTNSWKQWPVASLLVAFSLAAGLAAFFLIEQLAARELRVGSAARALVAASPVLFLILLASVWSRTYAGVSPAVTTPVLMALMAAAIWFHHSSGDAAITRLHLVMIGAVLAGALISTYTTSAARPRTAALENPERLKIPRILLLTVDTLRTDALTSYGGPADMTPNIDRLAADGVVFTRAYSTASWTLPAFASIFTGLTPWVHGTDKTNLRLPGSVPTLAESLQSAGFATGAVGSNSILTDNERLDGQHSDGKGFASGFDTYDFYPRDFPPGIAFRLLRKAPIDQYRDFDPDTDGITQKTLRFLNEHREHGFFLWTHYYDPHDPYAPPREFLPAEFRDVAFEDRRLDRQWFPSGEQIALLRASYDAEVRYVDDRIGRVLDELRTLGLYDEMLIVFTSDHGEEFFEHGALGHGHTMHDELLNVPLIIKLPGSTFTGRVDKQVSTVSILPTVLELAGVRHDANELAGRSLAEFWDPSTRDAAKDRIVFSKGALNGEPRESVIFSGIKYVRPEYSRRRQVYDMVADPLEATNLSGLRAELQREGERLLRLHRQWASETRNLYGIQGAGAGELDEETRRRLKALGYIR